MDPDDRPSPSRSDASEDAATDTDRDASEEVPVDGEHTAGESRDDVDGGGAEKTRSETPPDPETPEELRVALRQEGTTAPIGEHGRENRGPLYRFRHDMAGPYMWLREVLSSLAIVFVIGVLLFAVSGVWPPMVAVESGSMEPNMQVGDLVFVTEPGRLSPDVATNDIGVVTADEAEAVGYQSFGDHGSVVIYQPPGRGGSPIIHRAMFHVTAGENWYDRADERYHTADTCDELRNCPAPRSGFITLGDNNGAYDQASGLAEPVAAEWVTGVARARVPYLGYVRLITTGKVEPGEALDAVVGTAHRMPAVGSADSGAVGETVATVSSIRPAISVGSVDASSGQVGCVGQYDSTRNRRVGCDGS